MMKKNFLTPFLVLFLMVGLYACRQEKEVTVKEYPMFWTWLDYHPCMNFDSVCQVMNDIGMDGVMLNAPTPDDYRIAIPIAHKHGIEVYAWLWPRQDSGGTSRMVQREP